MEVAAVDLTVRTGCANVGKAKEILKVFLSTFKGLSAR